MGQLRQSACYQKSENLTCLTCHDPHAAERPKDVTAFYRQKCLDCHTVSRAGLPPTGRLRKDRRTTAWPAPCHAATPDIRTSPSRTTASAGTGPSRRPAPNGSPNWCRSTTSPPGGRDQQRNLGLAYLESARKPEYVRYADAFTGRARDLLETVHAAGLRDAETAEALAEIRGKKTPREQRLRPGDARSERRPGRGARLALLDLAKWEMRTHYPAAVGLLKELVSLRRCSEDWCLLGMFICCRTSRGRRSRLGRPYDPTGSPPSSTPAGGSVRQLATSSAPKSTRKAQWLFQYRPG